MKDELCKTGQELWDDVRTNFEEENYKNYVNHIKSCAECIKKLELTEEDIELLHFKSRGDKMTFLF